MTTRCIALGLVLFQGLAMAQTPPVCDSAAPAVSRMVSRATLSAMEAADRLVRSAGPSANLRSIRQAVLKDRYPSADVDQTLRRMLRAFCEVVRADTGLSESEKATRIQAADADMLKQVQGLAEVARTGSRIRRAAAPADGWRIEVASLAPGAWSAALLAQAPAAGADEYLRDAPSFVNDSNKYFVIVGSATSEKAAVDLMNRLHKKAPQYDFIVYLPYGSNAHYAVMMAAWVSREVANQALHAARKAVAPGAYLWACRSGGDSC